MFEQNPVRRLYRSRTNKQVTGVSAGLGDYFGIDPTVIRILWVVVTFVTFPVAPIAYITLACIMPQEPVSTDTYMI
jgi:phage shock protein C